MTRDEMAEAIAIAHGGCHECPLGGRPPCKNCFDLEEAIRVLRSNAVIIPDGFDFDAEGSALAGLAVPFGVRVIAFKAAK